MNAIHIDPDDNQWFVANERYRSLNVRTKDCAEQILMLVNEYGWSAYNKAYASDPTPLTDAGWSAMSHVNQPGYCKTVIDVKRPTMWVRINQPHTPVTCGHCGHKDQLNPTDYENNVRKIPKEYNCTNCGITGKTEIDY